MYFRRIMLGFFVVVGRQKHSLQKLQEPSTSRLLTARMIEYTVTFNCSKVPETISPGSRLLYLDGAFSNINNSQVVFHHFSSAPDLTRWMTGLEIGMFTNPFQEQTVQTSGSSNQFQEPNRVAIRFIQKTQNILVGQTIGNVDIQQTAFSHSLRCGRLL